MKIKTSEGRVIDLEHVNAVDRLVRAKRENQGNIDPVMDLVIETWKETRPKEWDSSIIEIKDARDNKYNKFAENKDGKGSGSMRRTVDVPVFFEMALRFLYSVEELPFNKEFYLHIWDRYPMFRVADEV